MYDEDNCGVAPTDTEWGDVGSSTDSLVTGHNHVSYTALDSTFLACMYAEMADDPLDSNANEHMFYICEDIHGGDSTDDDRDCQSPDGSSTPNVVVDASDFFRAAMADPDDFEQFLILIRDQDVEDAQLGGGISCTSVAYRRCVGTAGSFSTNAPACIVIYAPTDAAVTDNNGRTSEWITTCPPSQ